jgi:hypothetical protein
MAAPGVHNRIIHIKKGIQGRLVDKKKRRWRQQQVTMRWRRKDRSEAYLHGRGVRSEGDMHRGECPAEWREQLVRRQSVGKLVHSRGMPYPQGFRVWVPMGKSMSPGSEYPQYPCGYVALFFLGEETLKTHFLGYYLQSLTDITTFTPPKITEKCSGCSPQWHEQCFSLHQVDLTCVPCA